MKCKILRNIMALFHTELLCYFQTDDRTTMATKRMLWLDESMQAAVNSILYDNRGLREAARLYNIPVETLRRC